MGAIPPTNSDAGLNAVTVPGLSPITDPEARRPGDTDDKKPS
jgi:hypothetical protein